jgi:response regulator RpfG family c-di-GMP phosphodiesterase
LTAASGQDIAAASPIAEGVPMLWRVLWVDDHPDNNVYEVQALEHKDVTVVQVRSTDEAVQAAQHSASSATELLDMLGRLGLS